MTETSGNPGPAEGTSVSTCPVCHRRWRRRVHRCPGFEAVYREYRLPLLRYVRNQARDRGMADGRVGYEGIVQDAFTAMFLRWDTLREPRAWLFTVARRMVLARLPFHHRHTDHHPSDRHDRWGAVRDVGEDAEHFERSTVEPWWTSQVISPTTEQSLDAKRVVDLMEELPERQRVATYLHHVLGMPQAEIDRWHATHRPHEQLALRAFLTWARNSGRLSWRPRFPRLAITEGQRLTQHRRLELLRRVLDENAGPLRSRAAACLMLLFAQPASRIVLLTTEDLIQDADGQVLIRLGDPPAPVPEPFADLLLQARDQRTNMNTNNRDATWLFPGRRAGRPMHPNSLAELIRDNAQHGW